MSGIPTQDVVMLLQSLASAGPDALTAVAQMLSAASEGRPIEADVQSLGVDPSVFARVLEAAAAQGPAPVDRSAGLDKVISNAMASFRG